MQEDATTSLSVPKPLVKHVDLWFSDGSVVLQAESTLFRVHKSQLARRSVVFSDMFTLPQPVVATSHATIADETSEGCPVVSLHDSAEDVANLLLALYDGPCVSHGDHTRRPLTPPTENLATMAPMISSLCLAF